MLHDPEHRLNSEQLKWIDRMLSYVLFISKRAPIGVKTRTISGLARPSAQNIDIEYYFSGLLLLALLARPAMIYAAAW